MCKHPTQNPQRNGHTLALKRAGRLSLDLQCVAQKAVVDALVERLGVGM